MKRIVAVTFFSKIILIASLCCLFLSFTLSAKDKKKNLNKVYLHYIDLYKDIAITDMTKFKIPASITLAQGLIESRAGQSDLTRESNNHFGIKCHNDWKGKKVYRDDDKPHECFRKYKDASYSFADHSHFLADRSNYRALFSLKRTDYRGWAKGLQKAGYATDKAYANKLIKVIEDYGLYRFDNSHYKNKNYANIRYTHTPYKSHHHLYVIAKDDDSYESIAKEFGFKVKKLYQFNEVPQGFPLKKGDIVYFQKKGSKAAKPNLTHVVQIGESMYEISQQYDIKIKNLYNLNKKDFDYIPVEGDTLKLR